MTIRSRCHPQRHPRWLATARRFAMNAAVSPPPTARVGESDSAVEPGATPSALHRCRWRGRSRFNVAVAETRHRGVGVGTAPVLEDCVFARGGTRDLPFQVTPGLTALDVAGVLADIDCIARRCCVGEYAELMGGVGARARETGVGVRPGDQWFGTSPEVPNIHGVGTFSRGGSSCLLRGHGTAIEVQNQRTDLAQRCRSMGRAGRQGGSARPYRP